MRVLDFGCLQDLWRRLFLPRSNDIHFTTNAPRNIFIPQLNLKRPGRFGVNVTATGVFNGNGRLMPYAGMTISRPQVSSTVRTKVSSAGTPNLSITLAGW